ncbi:hypothetical protein Tco_0921309, partial [Tanacetum coccineum]
PLVWPSITVDGVTRLKEYIKLTPAETIQADCNIKAINIILQGLPTEIYALVSQHRIAKDLWEKIRLLMQGTSLTKQERECKLGDKLLMLLEQVEATQGNNRLSSVTIAKERVILPSSVLSPREKGMKHDSMIKVLLDQAQASVSSLYQRRNSIKAYPGLPDHTNLTDCHYPQSCPYQAMI